MCLGTGYFLRPREAIPPGFYPLRGRSLLPGAPKRGMPMGSKVFLALPVACGLRPCDWTHLKRPCAIFVRWWDASINTRGLRGRSQGPLGSTRLHSARILRYRGCIHFTTTSSGRFNLSFLRAMRGHFLRVGVSLAVINDQSK